MSKKLDGNENLESLIAEIQELLNEIKNEQTKISKEIEKHHRVTMRKLQKLKEFDEIADMTNMVFERRLSNIEQMLSRLYSN